MTRSTFDRGEAAIARAANTNAERVVTPASQPLTATRELVLEEVNIPSHDGTVLHGWIARPEGVQDVPVVLAMTPYLEFCRDDVLVHQVQHAPTAGACVPPPSEESWQRSSGEDGIQAWVETSFYPMDFVSRGYAIALVSVRGTGRSGGCYEVMGPNEQDDAAVVVEWLGSRPWSNGAVAMFGRSYSSWGAFSAAIDQAPSLEAIVVTGLFTDLYTWQGTPQGAAFTLTGPFWEFYRGATSLTPPLLSTGHPELTAERLCTAIPEHARAANIAVSDHRDQNFYDTRRLIDDFHQITAATLVVQGFDDFQGGSAHRTQESAVFQALTNAPKRQIEGHWGHHYPEDHRVELDSRWRSDTWAGIAFGWLDHYLRGDTARPEHLNKVDFQDSAGNWHTSRTWPPEHSADEVLYLTSSGLAAAPDGAVKRFQDTGGTFEAQQLLAADPALCPSPIGIDPAPGGIAYMTEPLQEPVTIAGNPHAYLDVSSSQSGGIVAVNVWELTPEFSCSPAAGATELDSDIPYLISAGAADLRFHQGNFDGTNFNRSHVRVDLVNLAETIETGNRLAVTISAGGADYAGQPYTPTITISGDGGSSASHLVLPMLDGTLGGHLPTLTYPPRPFVP